MPEYNVHVVKQYLVPKLKAKTKKDAEKLAVDMVSLRANDYYQRTYVNSRRHRP